MSNRLSDRYLAGLLAMALMGMPSRLPAQEAHQPVTAIIGAFGEEIRLILAEVADGRAEEHLGIRFVRGTLRGRAVVVAQTGIGKVNAAMTTALLLDHYHPAQVVFTGIAGALNPDLHPGDVVIGARLAQHDLGRLTLAGMERQGVHNPLDDAVNPVFFAADSALVQLAVLTGQQAASLPIPTGQGERLPAIRPGTIVTGDVFVASSAGKQSLRDGLQADAVEMEGAAVAQICYQQHVPFVVIRSISDSADETAEMDLQRFYRTAAANSARLVIDLAARLTASGNPAESGRNP